jgi:LmbE family N-acetylglucosaminyl deacetylase
MDLLSFQEIVSDTALRGEILFLGINEKERRWIDPPSRGTVLALAPHQDDPDAVAVTLRLFAQAGCRVRYLIVCSSHGGVTDSFAMKHAETNNDLPVKNLTRYKFRIRLQEQIESAELAGFVKDPVEFLTVREDQGGNLIESAENAKSIEQALAACKPDIVIMPYGEDTNVGHALVYRYFHMCAPGLALARGKPILALYNRDPKTVRISEQLVVPFGGEAARWKASLLQTHRSQQERNLEQRGYGLDERILRTNREIQQEVQQRVLERWKDECPYAEAFQVELFR